MKGIAVRVGQIVRQRLGQELAFVALVLLVGAVGPARAQTKRAMTLVDLIQIPQITEPRLSPDGRQVAFTMDAPDWQANERIPHLYRIDTDGSRLVQLTAGEHGESGSRWSPDGRTIAFVARRGAAKELQIFLIPNDGGEARQLSTHATSVSSISWAPGGDFIYFLAGDPKTGDEKKRLELKDDVYALDENYKQQHLWRIAVKDGSEQRITAGDFSVLDYRLSRDGSRIAHHRAPTPLFGDAELGEVWVMNADGSHAVQLTRNTVDETGAELSPDNAQVIFIAPANERFEPYYNYSLFIIPAGGGAARQVAPGFPHDVLAATWSKDGRWIDVVADMGVHSELFRLDPAGTSKPLQLTDGRHGVVGGGYEPAADRWLIQFDEPTRPGEIWMFQPGAGASPVRVTRVFDDLDRVFKLPREEVVHWKGADGVDIEGLLFYPADYDTSRRYPLVVQTHGGPRSSDQFGGIGDVNDYVAVLTGRGYAVLKPNYRGSIGYGVAFLRDMVGHYFQNAHLDVLNGVDQLVKAGVADPDRLIAMGWSAGGHMTNKLVTFTDRFKAASSGAGASNWISLFGQSDTRAYRIPWFGGTPWQKDAPIAAYWDHSPLKDVAKAKTPTIFFVGQNDVRVPLPQSMEMYRALKSHGVPTHLYVAPREPHVWEELRHVLFKANVELEWFEKYAMGRTYTPEKAPEAKDPGER
jgi:dipeptidyl aminopeptidase/acylaminoacyl peptidase